MKPIRILATDPGVANLGWAILEYHQDTGRIVVPKTGTLVGKHALKQRKDLFGVFENQFIILTVYAQLVRELFDYAKPDYVASEDAFMHRFVKAYASLILVIHTIRTVAYQYFCQDIYMIAPMQGKKAVSDEGNAPKELVQQSIQQDPNIEIKDSKQNPIEKMSQHAYDAIAVGIAFIRYELPAILNSKPIDKKLEIIVEDDTVVQG